ncbi:hypothetical protein GU926_10505 [Nibribacter ruber]|uniref:Uncharacterized protein n=1 Tax=Nibribacter ruber TaxID=2698458 RepID=A0A6P1NVG9_9BACT|nr:hypothetical protein [Nibribacter ruber]QHL87836.1 hypothetical protein GU926_10505 [Nibribacter ruber]
MKNPVRKDVGLLPIGNNLNLDSSFSYLPYSSNDPQTIKKKLANRDNLLVFYIADYYSENANNFTKTIFYKSQEGEVEVVKEVDTYIGLSNKRARPFLNFSYDFRNGDKSFRIDSLPSDYLVKRNSAKVDSMFKVAQTLNMELCGTSANQILKRGFPKRFTHIPEEEFKKLLKEFSKKAPKPIKS